MDSAYYKFRLSFVNEEFRPKTEDTIVTAIMDVFDVLGITVENEMTIGYHTYDKRGKDTTPHFHINFYGHKTESAMRKAVQIYCKSNPKYMGVVGTKLYSLTKAKEEDIRCIKRFYRYPFKMYHKCAIRFNTYFEDDGTETCPLELQTQMAIDEYEREKEKILANDKKREEKTSTYDKFINMLDEEKKVPTSKYEIQKELVQFYIKEKMSCNPQTMKGYVHTYLLQHKLVSIEEWIRDNL